MVMREKIMLKDSGSSKSVGGLPVVSQRYTIESNSVAICGIHILIKKALPEPDFNNLKNVCLSPGARNQWRKGLIIGLGRNRRNTEPEVLLWHQRYRLWSRASPWFHLRQTPNHMLPWVRWHDALVRISLLAMLWRLCFTNPCFIYKSVQIWTGVKSLHSNRLSVKEQSERI